MFKSSYEKLATFVDDALTQYPIDKNHLYLLGFSMGTVMSYALALTRPTLFRGIVANSGYIPENTHLTFLWDQVPSTEFLVTHGAQDPVIPIQFARRARQLLEEGHARFTYKEYSMAHEISQESLDDFGTWLTRRLNQTP